MDNKAEVREFLATRRAKLSPENAGLPAWGANRRVPGLRREEVAMLAGVSVDYYTRMERGNLSGVSESVLEALASALQLDEAERSHLDDLARFANATKTSRARIKQASKPLVRPEVQRILDSMDRVPAFVNDGRSFMLSANQLGRALYSEVYTETKHPVSAARFTFLNPRARAFFVDWEGAAATSVANLRTAAGKNPYDKELSDLVGELSTRSEEFATLWASHNVHLHRTGLKSLRHPVVGELHLSYEVLELPADPGLSLVTYTAEPNSPSADGLALLASWVATNEANEANEAAQNELVGDQPSEE